MALDSPKTRPARRRRADAGGALLLALIATVALTACAGTGSNRDPWEGVNRFFFSFNDMLDKVIGEPAAELYVAILPEPVRDGLHNAFDNLGYLNVIVNDFLQGKTDQGFRDLARMLVNSTLGIAGIFDVASGMGLERNTEDFGQTLAAWGVDPGPYLVLPVLGPSTTRDLWSVPVAIGTNPLFYFNFGAAVVVVGGFKAVDGRARADQQLRQVEDAALDRYVFVREAFLARREFLVRDGAPAASLDDALYEDFEDEEPDGLDRE
jgi:phospholipid-binding lipoprotein MlaA